MTFNQGIPRSPSQTRETGSIAAPYIGGRGVSAAILLAAAQRVILQAGKRTGQSPAAAEITDLLPVLTASIVETQVTARPIIGERIRSDLGRQLLDQLRREVVQGWSESGVADSELPPLLMAIERLRDALEPTPRGTSDTQFGSAGEMEVLADVAHDLRSPLTSILFLAETMQRGQSGPITQVQRRQLGLIYTTALGLSAVASDIIDLSRSDQLVEPAPIPFSVIGVLGSVNNLVRPIVDEKKLELRVLRPTVDQRLGHPVALSRVLLNLTTNALKFTDRGYVEIVTREVLTRRIEFAVRDSGRGIDPAVLATLFTPIRSSSGGPKGGRLFSRTGLGLTICRRLVRAMGSELQVESRPGWGTRFLFEIDLPPYISPRNTPPEGATTESAPGGRRRRSE